jgi:hypothetical protein
MGDDLEESDVRVREEVVAFLDHRDDVRGDVSRRDEERAAAQKLRYDSKLRGTREFLVGDLVMIVDPTTGKGKFDAAWRGPFEIVSKHHTSFRLQHLHHKVAFPGLYKPDHLKLYDRRPDHLNFVGDVVEREDFAPPTLRTRRPVTYTKGRRGMGKKE